MFFFSSLFSHRTDLGIKATQRIAAASDPLQLVADLSQALHTQISLLSRLPLNTTVVDAVRALHSVARAGRSLVMVNGRVLDEDTLTPFALLSLIRDELRLAEAAENEGIDSPSLHLMLRPPLPSNQVRGTVSGEGGGFVFTRRM